MPLTLHRKMQYKPPAPKNAIAAAHVEHVHVIHSMSSTNTAAETGMSPASVFHPY